jgi:hypothetical protein
VPTLPKAVWLAAASVAYAGLLLVLAATVPVYATDDSATGAGSATLIAVNGPAIAVVPLAAALLVFALLHVACRGGSRLALVTAWTLAVLTLMFAVLGLLTIGIAILPLGVLLACACSATPVAGSARC